MKAQSGKGQAASGKAPTPTLRERATIHRRASEVCLMIAQIEDTLRCHGADVFRRLSGEDQACALIDLQRLDDAGFALEWNLKVQPLTGGAR